MHSCQDIVGLYYVGLKQILLQMLLCYFIDSFAYLFHFFVKQTYLIYHSSSTDIKKVIIIKHNI